VFNILLTYLLTYDFPYNTASVHIKTSGNMFIVRINSALIILPQVIKYNLIFGLKWRHSNCLDNLSHNALIQILQINMHTPHMCHYFISGFCYSNSHNNAYDILMMALP